MTASGRRRIVVINRNGAPRYAISFFLGPNHDWIVGCVPTCVGPANRPRYEPTDHVVNKKAEVVRVYLPPDANCLLSVTDHCLRSRITSTSLSPASSRRRNGLTMDEAVKQ